MEEKIRLRPSTPRVAEKKSEDFSEMHDPLEIFTSVTGFSASLAANLLKLELQINTEEIAVHKFGGLCPLLKELKLSGSSIDSLRTLGTEWGNIEILWLVRTGLLEIDGVSAFPKLKELYCAFNSIKSLSALMFHESISVLDVEGNRIEDWSEVEYLQYSSNLTSINLEGNPISSISDYREKVFTTLPQVLVLDDIAKEDTSESKIEDREEMEIIHNSVRESQKIKVKAFSARPNTASNIFQDESSHLTEEVFSGNPLKAMRYRRKKLFHGGNEDILSLIREFKVEEPKVQQKVQERRPIVVKNKNIVIRSVRREEFYETH